MANTHPPRTSRNVAVLWTGGKDSCLALYETIQMGYQVQRLVTFVPTAARFRAHPLVVMDAQAQALRTPHSTMEVAEPYDRSYREAILTISESWGVGTLVTGDRAPVDGHPNWIGECTRDTGVGVLNPLWGRDCEETLNRFLALGFRALFSCVRTPWLTADWVGRELDAETLGELRALAQAKRFDVCGEQGEYHTLVLDGPLFHQHLRLETRGTKTTDDLAYITLEGVYLEEKTRRQAISLHTTPAHHKPDQPAGKAPCA